MILDTMILLRKAEVSSATKTFLFLLKTQKTSTATVGPEHLKVEVADKVFPNCSYVINRTCQYTMLIM